MITEKTSFLRYIDLLKYWGVKQKMSGICFIIYSQKKKKKKKEEEEEEARQM